jgi:alpha-beta hydrolase superfamily lysophospholipase
LHGSGEERRLSYCPLVAAYIHDGIAFFSYDKRGVGESEGECCPDVYGRFNLVTADAVGAVAAIRRLREIDPDQVGFLGASAAGWVAPRAAETSKHVAFVAIARPWCPPTQRRRELRALRWRKREHQATPVRGCDREEGQ